MFNARHEQAKKAAEILDHYYLDNRYSKLILAGCGDYKCDVLDLVNPRVQKKIVQVQVSYSGEAGWRAAIRAMANTIALGPCLEQSERAAQFLQDFDDPYQNCITGQRHTLAALERGAVQVLLLSDPCPDLVPGVLVEDLEDYVVALCEEQNTELQRITNFDSVTNMFAGFGGIGGYLRWKIDEDQLDPDLLCEVETVDIIENHAAQDFLDRVLVSNSSTGLADSLEKVQTSTKKRKKRKPSFEYANGKKNLNLIFCGHVDSGKSTTVGHLLVQNGQIDERQVVQNQRKAQANSRGNSYLAYIMDSNEEEQAKGITVESGYAHFETEERRYTIVDAPGHQNYLTNMIEGASQADMACLMLSARATEFEDGFAGGQTKEHARLAFGFDMRKILLVVNKMDACNWDEDRYNFIVDKTKRFLKKVGFKPSNICAVPISGVLGVNLSEPMDSTVCPWYRGGCLLDVLDNIKLKTKKLEKQPLRMTVVDRQPNGRRVVARGRIESGALLVGQNVLILPSRTEALVASIQIDEEFVDQACPRDHVVLALKGCDFETITPGTLICSLDDSVEPVREIAASIRVENLNPLRPFLMPGYRLMFHCHALTVPCEIVHVEKDVLRQRGQESNIVIHFDQPIVLESYTVNKRLGSFILREEEITIAIGRVQN